MLTANSPFLNIPAGLDRKQAVYLDGICHAVQIAHLSYTRLCGSLTSISQSLACENFTYVFLDAWAFVDAVDRFHSLLRQRPMTLLLKHSQPASTELCCLEQIRKVRNVAAHIATKIDQILKLNSSVVGEISWVSLHSENPLRIKTHVARPWVVFQTVNTQLAMPTGKINFPYGSSAISINAGSHKANLSEAYEVLIRLVKSAETVLSVAFQEFFNESTLPRNVFGSADLETGGLWPFTQKPSYKAFHLGLQRAKEHKAQQRTPPVSDKIVWCAVA